MDTRVLMLVERKLQRDACWYWQWVSYEQLIDSILKLERGIIINCEFVEIGGYRHFTTVLYCTWMYVVCSIDEIQVLVLLSGGEQ